MAKNHRQKEQSLYEKIDKLQLHAKRMEYSISTWASRYDERMDMILHKKHPDQKQKHFVHRTYHRDDYFFLLDSMEDEI